MGCCSIDNLSKAERQAIARHRMKLSSTLGREVSQEEALDDWIANCRQRWKEERLARMLALQREEILRHKWIESEKRCQDVGAEAVFDWINRYAAGWRKWFDDNDE